jgi:hypothetical protein
MSIRIPSSAQASDDAVAGLLPQSNFPAIGRSRRGTKAMMARLIWLPENWLAGELAYRKFGINVGAQGPTMNQSVHQLLQIILQGFTWFLKTIEALWVWSWAQITAAFNMSWGNMPGWKIAVALIAMAILIALLFVMFRQALAAFGKIAAAFWTMAVTASGLLAFVVTAGLFSRGIQWVVASVPDHFWEKFLSSS